MSVVYSLEPALFQAQLTDGTVHPHLTVEKIQETLPTGPHSQSPSKRLSTHGKMSPPSPATQKQYSMAKFSCSPNPQAKIFHDETLLPVVPLPKVLFLSQEVPNTKIQWVYTAGKSYRVCHVSKHIKYHRATLFGWMIARTDLRLVQQNSGKL